METTESSPIKVMMLLRLLVPQVLLFSLLIVNMLALPFPYAGTVNPYFVLMAVYYWAIYRPTMVSSLVCFVAGLLLDILSGGLLGMNAFILILFQWVVRSQRRFLMGQPFLVMWFIFSVVVLSAALMQWGMSGFSAMQWGSPLSALFNAVVSFFLFPFVSLLLILTHRILPS